MLNFRRESDILNEMIENWVIYNAPPPHVWW